MTDWKKRYSVQINLAAMVIGVAVAAVEFVQKQDPTTPLSVVVLGLLTLIAAKIPQGPKADS